MSEMDMKNEIETETEEFADELSDEALDRDEGGGKLTAATVFCLGCR